MNNLALKYKDNFLNILNSKSHAVLIESEDELLSKQVALLFACNLLCKEHNAPCGECSTCCKILDGNCLDVTVLDKTLLVEDVSKIIEDMYVVPAENEYKIIILNNFSMASERVQNKLLKSLEEPPRFVKFVILAKNTNSILPTVLSRCEKFAIKPFSLEQLKTIFNENNSQNKNVIIENSNNSYGEITKYLENKDFVNVFNLSLDMLKNMNKSNIMLKYSSQIAKLKDNINLFVKITQNILSDVCYYIYNMQNLINNKSHIEDIELLANEFSTKACTKIIENLDKVKEKLMFNVNVNFVVDSMLLNILEVKYKCKK